MAVSAPVDLFVEVAVQNFLYVASQAFDRVGHFVRETARLTENAGTFIFSAECASPAADDANTLTYTVQDGEDITDVSIRWGVTASAIRELNNLGENDKLKAGQVLRLPADAQQN